MTIDEIRRKKLGRLAEELGGVGALAIKIGKSSAQVSQWINASPDSKTGKPRGMRSDSCRAIESACGKPQGWMDSADPEIDSEGAARNESKKAISEDPVPPSRLKRNLNWSGLQDGPALNAALNDLKNRASRRSQQTLAHLIDLANRNALSDDDWEAIEWLAKKIGKDS